MIYYHALRLERLVTFITIRIDRIRGDAQHLDFPYHDGDGKNARTLPSLMSVGNAAKGQIRNVFMAQGVTDRLP